MKNITAIFFKQCKDALKNQAVLVQFLMFPVISIIMTQAIHVEGLPQNYFVNLFSAMYIGMAPLTSITAILAEEKEQNTLRMLFMSNVRPHEYFIGAGGFLFLICMAGSLVMGITGGYRDGALAIYLLAMASGILTSLLIGAAIGTWGKNQMAATSLTVPLMMIFSFLPMLSAFNETIAKFAKFAYSEQVSILLNHLTDTSVNLSGVPIIGANMAAAALCFYFAYKKCGLA